MRKSYYFLNDIELEEIQNLIDRLDSLEGDIDLFFETEGGDIDTIDYLLHYLNKRSEEIIVYLIGQLSSAGTKILTDYKGKIILHEGLELILFHKWDRRVYTLRKNNSVDSKILVQQTDSSNKKFYKKLEKLGLNKKQLKLYDEGKDVILYKKDFKQLKL